MAIKVRIYPVKSIAEMFEVTPETVRNWIKKGLLKAHKRKINGKLIWVATGENINDFLDVVCNKDYYRWREEFYGIYFHKEYEHEEVE